MDNRDDRDKLVNQLKDDYQQSDQRPFDIAYMIPTLLVEDCADELIELIDDGMDLICSTAGAMIRIKPYNSLRFLLLCKLIPINNPELTLSINCRYDGLQVLADRGVSFKVKWDSPSPRYRSFINVFYNYRFLTELPQLTEDEYIWYIVLTYFNLPFQGNTDQLDDSDDKLVIKVNDYRVRINDERRTSIHRLGILDKLTCENIQRLMRENNIIDVANGLVYVELLFYAISNMPDNSEVDIQLPDHHGSDRFDNDYLTPLFMLMHIKGMIDIGDYRSKDSNLAEIVGLSSKYNPANRFNVKSARTAITTTQS